MIGLFFSISFLTLLFILTHGVNYTIFLGVIQVILGISVGYIVTILFRGA